MRRLLILLASLVLLLAGCGGDDEGSGNSSSSASSEESKVSRALEHPTEKPKPDIPDGPAPKELEIEDIKEGSGTALQGGDTAGVAYVGVLYENGEEFDSSYANGSEPFEFVFQAGQVIPGWDKGLEGMKVGGRRQLTIPAKDAYGAQGSGGIPPNAPLVFVVDLLSIS